MRRLNPAIAMFLEAFGLASDPFLDTADPAYYYETLPVVHGRRRLVEALTGGRGLAVIVGPIGAGKTTLCNAVQHTLLAQPRNLVAAVLDPTFAGEVEMLRAIADSFGFDVEADAGAGSGASPRAAKEALKRALFLAASAGRQPILFVDEAQLLPEALFETVRSLLNYQLDDRKLLCVAMAGQMEFAATVLRHPNFSDRVAHWTELGPLSEADSAGLLHHRLRCAGFAAERSPFDDDALHALWSASAGIPRRLTTLARESMEVAADYSRQRVRRSDVVAAVGRILPLARAARAPDAAAARRRFWEWWRRAS